MVDLSLLSHLKHGPGASRILPFSHLYFPCFYFFSIFLKQSYFMF